MQGKVHIERAREKTIETNRLSPVAYLTGIAFLVLLSRLMFSPLLPVIEDDLKLTHGQAGGLFFFMSVGFSISMLLSGFIAGLLTHRWTILTSAFTATAALFALSFCRGLHCMQGLLVLLGAGGGLYLPSAMATITNLVKKKRRGRAIGIHEIGFNMSFIAAPLAVRFILPIYTWRVSLIMVAACTAIAGFAFMLFGTGGRMPGEPPRMQHIRTILSRPQFWIIGTLFAVVIGAEIGVYSMIPTYLVSSEGMELNRVNTLLSLSRVSSLVMVFVTGWLVDRFGAKALIMIVLSVSAVLTVLLGFSHEALLLAAVFAQPLVIICFFPAGLSALSDSFSSRLLSLAISFMIPFAYFFGAGLVPAGMGFLGERGLFSVGFYITGASLIVVLIPLYFLELTGHDRTG
jgi:NNP family nitrate/nitrite transporter-like MFS transporter